MTRTIKCITIFLFYLILLMPFLEQTFHFLRIKPLDEHRIRTRIPRDWRSMFLPGNVFAHKFEQYFNDNYPVRDLLIRTKNQLDFSIFRVSSEVVIGEDKWLFHKSVAEFDQYELEHLSNDKVDRFFQRIVGLNNFLKMRNITLVVIPCPVANTIYREKLPGTTMKRPVDTVFQRYRRFLKNHPEILAIDPEPILQDMKRKCPVYYKTDFHWNDVAGYFVGRELVNKLAERAGIPPLWALPFQVEQRRFDEGGTARALGLFSSINEETLFLKTHNRFTESGHWDWGVPTSTQFTYRATNSNTSQLIPNTVMFTDSYIDSLLNANFSIYFSYLHRFYIMEDFKNQFHLIPPDTKFFILLHVENQISSLMNDDFWPSELRD